VKPVLNLVCYVSLCEGLRDGAGSLSYIVHVDCCGLSTIVIKKIIIIIIIIIITSNGRRYVVTLPCEILVFETSINQFVRYNVNIKITKFAYTLY